MKMNKKLISMIIVAILLITMLMPTSAFADGSDLEIPFEDCCMSYLIAQYDMRNIEYDSLDISDTINLYDNDNNVIAEIVAMSRDSDIDYVLINLLTNSIDEFGFNRGDYISFLADGKHLFYAGVSQIAYYENDILTDVNGNEVDKESFFDAMADFLYISENMPGAKDGFSGIMTWGEMCNYLNGLPNSTGYNGEIRSNDWGYLSGITQLGVASGLNFKSQTALNNYYNNAHGTNITGTCAPTAITNMFIYYKYIGFSNALFGGNANTAFEKAIQKTDWMNWTNSNWWSKTQSGLKAMATASGYSYTIKVYPNATWNNFKKCIKTWNMPVFTYVSVNTSNNSTFAHAVVTMGYEEFVHHYTTTETYWLLGWHERTIEHDDKYCYLRVVDGWDSSNSGRYLDFNGYYDVVKAIGFKLNG